MNIIEKSIFLKTATIWPIVMLLYFMTSSLMGDPRFDDGEITSKEMFWWENILFAGGMILIACIWLGALIHAFDKNKNGWGVAIFFIWPLSYIYSWKYGSER